MTEWPKPQPINTALPDTPVFVYCPVGTKFTDSMGSNVMVYSDWVVAEKDGYGDWWTSVSMLQISHPTHWLPCPHAP